MQALVTLLPDELAARVVEARASVSEIPSIGRIYDPPFAHFSQQLAVDYDWDGLSTALAKFAEGQQPFEVTTSGLLCFTGSNNSIAISVRRDERLIAFHRELWEVAKPFAAGDLVPFYHPDRWVPHVTIKRCGADAADFGAAMAKLANERFDWTMMLDNIAVQHDPGQNSLTHSLRLRIPFGKAPPADGAREAPDDTNAIIKELREPADGEVRWQIKAITDAGDVVELSWDAQEVVRIMAAAKSSTAHFPSSRCLIENGPIVSVVPETPFPVAQ